MPHIVKTQFPVQYVVLKSVVGRRTPNPTGVIIDAYKPNTLLVIQDEKDGWLMTQSGKWILKTDEVMQFKEWNKLHPGGIKLNGDDNTIIAGLPIFNAAGITTGSVIKVNSGAVDPVSNSKIAAANTGTDLIVASVTNEGYVQIQTPTGGSFYAKASDVQVKSGTTYEAVDTSKMNTSVEKTYIQQMQNAITEFVKANNNTPTGAREEGLARIIETTQLRQMRNIFGMPYQFLPAVDPRLKNSGTEYSVSNNSGYGRMFAKKILSRMPILVLQAGVPDFLQGWSSDAKNDILKELENNAASLSSNLQGQMNTGSRYYAFQNKGQEYFDIVNSQCRAAAHLLRLEDVEFNGHKLGSYNWADESLAEKWKYYAWSTLFYVNAEPSVGEDFSNQTSQSQLLSQINDLGRKSSEIQFLMGGAAQQIAKSTGISMMNTTNYVTDSVAKGSNTGTIFDNLLSNLETIMAGGRMAFPELWQDSSTGRTYNVTIKLDSPDPDILSIYLNILVPIMHILGLVAPRSLGYNNYVSPFIVRAYYKSMFHIDMGIITSCQIQRGNSGSWNQNGMPTEVTITLGIKDLYDVLTVALGDEKSYLSNPAQLDYIANLCGINVYTPSLLRTLRLYWAMYNPVSLYESYILNNIRYGATAINRAWMNLFRDRNMRV